MDLVNVIWGCEGDWCGVGKGCDGGEKWEGKMGCGGGSG